ncbi:hypothetical protein L3049_10580 [Labilibaculum sp. DW002]|uniref:DUF5050 domain-containing protein n=1 Tax=Paralabilibaculum antarcticum TaxID=2912572 RepID=A0ABT5VVW8_9BACT|nr:hypothetical protein [Labilibaculum sp. DW002]MDE5418454.1 hypothetical protein [Labilibaculum sp. DW002]
MMKHLTLRNVLSAFALFILWSCSDENSATQVENMKFDFSNAKGVFLAPGSNTKSTENTSNKIFKITEDGYVLEVQIEDENGKDVTSKQVPIDIRVMSENYIDILFESGEYLVRLSDGAAFSFDGATPKVRKPFPEYNGEEFSSNGNEIIYITENDELIALDVVNPNSLSFKLLSASGDKVDSFCADSDGNVIYSSYDDGDNRVLRYRNASNGFELLPGTYQNIHTHFWTDPDDNNIFFFNSDNNYIQKINTTPFTVNNFGNKEPLGGMYTHNLLKIKNKNRVIAISSDEYIYDLYNNNQDVRSILITAFGLKSLKFGAASDNYYYVIGLNDTGKANLLKIDPTDDSYEVLINGSYDISKLDVSPNDEIIFNALSMADGKNVIGEIDPSGNINIIDETINSQVTVLERIN